MDILRMCIDGSDARALVMTKYCDYEILFEELSQRLI